MVGIDTVLNIIDICAGVFIGGCGLCWFIVNFFSNFYFGSLVSSLFIILFGVILVTYVLFRPAIIMENFALLDNWLGYGCYILYCGVICWSGANIPVYIFGSLVVVLGVVYIVFHFINKVEKPGPLLGAKSQPSGNTTQSTSKSTEMPAQSAQPAQPAQPVYYEEPAANNDAQKSAGGSQQEPAVEIEIEQESNAGSNADPSVGADGTSTA
ncbi:uncharacterized protein MONOS_2781 [Monocercomonoides exilis]|uniref:uncharacterized protein n=1 Tax=Monocercomonoides exilis TaxID=2049356 RepID=UPI0035598375|nr:hypothetical protein MONOS_2781 [Monocercomonoides exilis]|eukprot:MONOS_2781.1-p1 / transcript=MONOS_2781.1 / gene=MONOS_2781 / organism=Monocercomonoides_exilis_PA203 / gene_product=unspecified product / transcript_product=unspecified product / location=Mono_scaffold00059:111242-112063(+) / protein_length=210 / sequence_SO=supercontig / SO=protein_coding / is_pseudo=false